MAKKISPTAAWEALLEELMPPTRDAILRRTSSPLHAPPEDEDDTDDDDPHAAYLRLCDELFPSVRNTLLKRTPVAIDKPVVTKEETRWCAVYVRDGEWPTLAMFRTAENLANQLQRLEGSDVVAYCFYGVPLAITKGPQRFLQLPNGQYMEIPLYEGAPCRRFDARELAEPEFETTGFLGPPELSETVKPVTVEED